MYKTNEALIDKQVSFWDEDFALENDQVSKTVEEIPLKDLSLPDSTVLEIYKTDPKDAILINDLIKAIESGVNLPPILIDTKNQVIDGYHRFLACEKIGYSKIPCIRLNRQTF